MAKIKSGILGGYSGHLANIVGYRRKGKSIIQSKSNNQNKNLTPTMFKRTSIVKSLETIYNGQLSASEKLFWNNSWQSIPMLRRWYIDLRERFPQHSPSVFQFSNVHGINHTQIPDFQFSINKATRKVKITWLNLQPLAGQPNSMQYFFWIINLKSVSKTSLINNISSRDGHLEIQYNVAWVGSPLICQLGFRKVNAAAPHFELASPLYWFFG